MKFRHIVFFLAFGISACAPAAQTPSQNRMVDVYSTAAAAPWLIEFYDCAASLSLTLRLADSPSAAQIQIRLGGPETWTLPAYQIGEERILIAAHRQSPIQELTLEEAQALFAGSGDPSVQVWVYASDEDLQKVFDQFVMSGRSAASFARLAVSPQQMSDVLNAEKNAVGILPERWKMGDVREVREVGIAPALAILNAEPNDALMSLLSCVQEP